MNPLDTLGPPRQIQVFEFIALRKEKAFDRPIKLISVEFKNFAGSGEEFAPDKENANSALLNEDLFHLANQ